MNNQDQGAEIERKPLTRSLSGAMQRPINIAVNLDELLLNRRKTG